MLEHVRAWWLHVLFCLICLLADVLAFFCLFSNPHLWCLQVQPIQLPTLGSFASGCGAQHLKTRLKAVIQIWIAPDREGQACKGLTPRGESLFLYLKSFKQSSIISKMIFTALSYTMAHQWCSDFFNSALLYMLLFYWASYMQYVGFSHQKLMLCVCTIVSQVYKPVKTHTIKCLD